MYFWLGLIKCDFSSNYVRDSKTGKLKNAEWVDNSFKWAGGGFLSTAPDLVKFGFSMLSCYQYDSPDNYLSLNTMKEIWTAVPKTKCAWESGGCYGMGWCVHPKYFSHTGGSVGSSSVLVVAPKESCDKKPQGITVAIICNMQGVSLYKTAKEIVQLFKNVKVADATAEKQINNDQDDLHDILWHSPTGHDD